MNGKKWLSLALVLTLALSLAACGGSGTAVYVQNVGELMNLGGIAPGDRFQGIVVSENVTEIEKDGEKTVHELKVKEGEDVIAGQELFSYDTEELQLSLDKQRLELEQLKASIENYKEQIEELERDKKNAGGDAKLQYTIQIQTTQVSLKEAEINVKTKENEVKKSQELLDNAVVTAPVAGRIQSINENGTDQRGNPVPYIVIQQAGAYRVKGSLGELQRGGIQPGSKVKVISRMDDSQVWTGTVDMVDYESPIKDDNSSGMMIMGTSGGEMTSSSKYPFYVKLDSTQGLLLGQHVYLELDTGSQESAAGISSAFLVFEEDGSAYVWAEKGSKLEKRPVTLGEYNPEKDTYQILEGLSMDDYIAFPDPTLCVPGAPTTHEYVAPEEAGGEEMPMDEMPMDEMPMDEEMPMDGGEVPVEELPADGAELPGEATSGTEAPVEGTDAPAAGEGTVVG